MRNHGIEEFITREERKRKLKLRRWVKNCLFIMLGIAITLIVQDYKYNINEYQSKTGSPYTCRGTIVRACYGAEMPE